MHVAHLNIARLRALPGDPLVAEFVENVPRVNALAERSPGFVWRLADDSINTDGPPKALLGDPLLAFSLTVWKTPEELQFFVKKTVHGAFLRRRENWFEPTDGPNYVIWPIAEGELPTLDEGKARLAMLAALGSTEAAYDFSYLKPVE